VPIDARAGAEQLPGVLVALFSTPLWFANASHFRDEVMGAVNSCGPSLSLLVLDVIGMSDLDYTGAKTLRQVMAELEARHITFALARPGRRVRVGLERSGLLDELGDDHLFGSVDEAVVALLPSGP
jgi:MFS superfamily sulfate permease-like transporter